MLFKFRLQKKAHRVFPLYKPIVDCFVDCLISLADVTQGPTGEHDHMSHIHLLRDSK